MFTQLISRNDVKHSGRWFLNIGGYNSAAGTTRVRERVNLFLRKPRFAMHYGAIDPLFKK
jgi:hypothetical protein